MNEGSGGSSLVSDHWFEKNETGGCWISRRFKICDDLEVLKHAKHDRADQSESRVCGENAQSADEKTCGHLKPSWGKL